MSCTISTKKVHEGDVGVRFGITLVEDGQPVDISTATAKKYVFEKPDMTSLEVDADFVSDGSDGQLEYYSEVGDLSPDGRYRIQAYVEMDSGKFHSDIDEFHVFANLPLPPEP